jgi:hypothetical protein
LAADGKRVREVQRTLVEGRGGPGVLLWPYQDLPPDQPLFVAANLLTVAGVWRADEASVFLEPSKPITVAEWRAAVERMPAATRESLRAKQPATRGEAIGLLGRYRVPPLPPGSDG